MADRPMGNRRRRKVCGFCVDKVEHIDYKDYSDCSHSDHQNSNIHTDDAGNGFLKEFPPAIRE